ncbi:MAG: thiamine pyrophosphate-dependent enzyme [Bdellovibrionaceae bacterium]|nr:thiamine pyrophosphate-dependent enzyme [Pseudobdellovibrionaceae bacterium]
MLFIKNKLFANPTKDPHFSVSLKNSKGESFKLADPKANRALVACMDMEAGLQGAASHWGGPSAFAEIISALHTLIFHQAIKKKQDWFELFHIINDAGHCENGLYALRANYGLADLSLKDLKHFRSLTSVLTGHGEAHLFPSAIYLSNGPLGSTVGQAQGLAMADKLSGSKRTTVLTLSDGACMEGEVKEALNAIPGFAKKNQINPFLMIISYNNTKLTGRIDEDSFCLKPFLKSLSTLGWDSSFISEGHNLKKVFDAIERALEKLEKKDFKPIALIFETCKGFGIKKTQEESSGGHGFPLKKAEELLSFVQEIYTNEKIPTEILNWIKDIQHKKVSSKPSFSYFKSVNFQKTQIGISKALIEQKEKGLPIISISSDLYGSTGLASFRKKFPKDSFDVGVAEANMISVAVGFSKQGFIPITDTFAQFAVTKGNLPLFMSALSQAPLIGVFSHAGFQDAADGASHQALSYLAQTCSLPKTQVYVLSCAEEAYHFLSQSLNNFYQKRKEGKVPESQLFFLGRETFPESFNVKKYSLDKAQVLLNESKKSKPVLIITCGPLVTQALIAGRQLAEKDQACVIINNPCISKPDTKTISKWLKICEGRLMTVEDHQAQGGLASQVLLSLKKEGISISQFKSLAVQKEIGRSAYTALELYKKFGLDHEFIAKTVQEF